MFNDIRSIIPRSIKRAGIKRAIIETDVFSHFLAVAKKFLSEEEMPKIKPVFLRDGILIVASLSEDSTTKLGQKGDVIISEINERLGEQKVKGLKILT